MIRANAIIFWIMYLVFISGATGLWGPHALFIGGAVGMVLAFALALLDTLP